MRCLYESTREYPTSQTYAADRNGNGSAPMDVSAVFYGKGKKCKGKKGKDGKSKGVKFDGNCNHCGKYGHKKETCWSNVNAVEEHGSWSDNSPQQHAAPTPKTAAPQQPRPKV